MTQAILVVVVSVAAGTLLGLMPGKHSGWLGPIRTFALTAALGVVALHLLPEAFEALGGWALLGLGVGFWGPGLLGRAGAFLWRTRRTAEAGSQLTLEASYVGLLIHHLGDGLALGAYTGDLHAGHSHGDVMTAIAAHVVPVVAIMVLAFDSAQGRGSALFRAVGLAVASVIGIYFANSVPAHFAESSAAWVTALVSGLLVHVVTHDLAAQAPVTARARTLDVLLAAAGFATALLGNSAHHEDGPPAIQERFVDALLELSLETAPLLLLGVAIGALIQTFGGKIPPSWLRSRGIGWDALRGTLVGAPLPLCSCSVLPVSEALRRRGAAPALVVAFLLATPEIGVETFLLSAHFLGWPLAWVRLFGALATAFGAALVVGLLLRRHDIAHAEAADTAAPFAEGPHDGSSWARFLHGFDDLLHHIGAWMVLGLVGAAFLQVLLPAEALTGRGLLLDLVLVSAVAIPSYICAPSATPVAAVLIAKGLSPGVVLVGLLLGPATNVVTLFFLRRWFGSRVAAALITTIVVVSWSLAPLVNAWVPVHGVAATEVAEHAHTSWLTTAFGLISATIVLRSIWLSGIRAWLATLRSDAGHGHAHGDGHGSCCHGPCHPHEAEAAFPHGQNVGGVRT